VLTARNVTDVPAAFIADPFMVREGGTWRMFFEVFNRKSGKGEIGCAESTDGLRWNYQGIVVSERYHLSYPHVLHWKGDYFMVPESYKGTNSVTIYIATSFPTHWKCVGTILDAGCYVDTSLLRYRDRWWLFTETHVPESDTLRLYHSSDLFGGWQEHPCSPLLAGDPHHARPGGRVVLYQDRIIRFAQDCWPRYGLQVHAFEVTVLETQEYRECPVGPCPILGPTGSGWNSSGMHHVDPHPIAEDDWLACADGSYDL